MKKIATVFISLFFSLNCFAAHHEDTINLEQFSKLQGWDLDAAQISSQKLNDNLYVLFKDLDISKMNEACKILIGKKDFTSFAKVNTDTMNNNCHIIRAEWKKERTNYIFIISADRFLRNMVRSIVGSLIDVGTGKRDVQEIECILAKKDRCEAGTSVPRCHMGNEKPRHALQGCFLSPTCILSPF